MSTKNTIDDNSLQRFPLQYEQSPSDLEQIADAIARHTMRQYEKIVLFINKAGLLHKLRFGRKA